MATILLSAAGAAVGGAIGGSVLGLSAAVIGRAVGATIGQSLDQRLMGAGSEVIETGRIDRFRVTGASEGSGVAQVFGRTRIAGQVIWASNFLERRQTQKSSGGKGGAGGASVRSYSYSVSLAIALCEGEISHVGRIWADGYEVARSALNLRVYPGSETQVPDPKISAIEGAGNVPAYRGTAYIVLEDLDLGQFGNRVPQFSFEVIRPEQAAATASAKSLVETVQAVALIPGTGEYALATTPVHYSEGPGRKRPANVHSYDGRTDFLASMTALEAELPKCASVSLVVSWFGDDLRCGKAKIRPKVEHKDADGTPMQWGVAGLDRFSALQVAQEAGRPVYGGTPSDQSVVEAITSLRSRGKSVVFYPFILMEQLAGNGLVDPWTGEAEQPPLPWRGRISLSIAPGRAGSPDGTVAAASEVAAFFGSATASDFTISDRKVTYSGASEWSFRRFILHNAALCLAAGGVDAFCIGSEMRGLTQIRGAGNSFPAVSELVRLADEVRSILGPAVKIGYAADWSEYFGYDPADGTGDHFFHLDPLWAHSDIDFIGIDNYMPLSDWREGTQHADAQAGWETIYDLDYLKSNIAGGEGFDWFYPDAQAAHDQVRTPITDGAYGEPWVYRYKDLVSWWSNAHHNRIGGVRQMVPTSWVPQSKPIWFTEIGCAALDKATNEPNKFLDPKSSESVLPRASNGARDDLIQMQYLRATYDYWTDPLNNPMSGTYGGRMVDMAHAHVWAWDARPYPWFPGLPEIWSDGDNYTHGHWLNGRTGSQLLATVVTEICQNSGLTNVDVSGLYGLVRGFGIAQPTTARQALEPLMLAYGFDAHERNGTLVFRNRSGKIAKTVEKGELVLSDEQESTLLTLRGAGSESAGRIRLTFVAADGSFDAQVSETSFPEAEAQSVSATELNLVMTTAEARHVAERWLSEARIAGESCKFALPPSSLALGAGDVVAIPTPSGVARYRIDRVEDMGLRLLEAIRVEPESYLPGGVVEGSVTLVAPPAKVPPTPVILDLPLLTNTDVQSAPYIAVASDPWPGAVAIYDSAYDQAYSLNAVVEVSAILGVTQTPLAKAAHGIFDRGPTLEVVLSGGALSSVTMDALLAGANAMAIGDQDTGHWEIFQFQTAVPLGSGIYGLSDRLRGQLGTDALIPDLWPAGSTVVLLDDAIKQLSFPSNMRGLARHYRIGPADLTYDDNNFVHLQVACEAAGLRPFAPVHLQQVRDAAGVDRISWIRRTRIDGDIWSIADAPLGEAREEYLLHVLVAGTVVRTVTVAQPLWSYEPSMRAADGVVGAYEVQVAQISDRVGAGLFRRIMIND
ncbi:glycoside hydrolase/phage tail family protein [Pseudoruegeria sp. SK021]|uniref:baseplate multidomain protein megatron n=1 Tax=Pseudoruegeria sp. SK021 TaxID=1933035 RepID=UPI000A21DCD3|nr:glycoside hydrolase/phage tail family protein [Pseudoruegeria sp. SK021]OSP54335.1 host specificity protein [Pseudoruegeria sp. SK021]